MKSVLIIEDEAAVASALQIVVRRLGHDPSCAASGSLGLEKLEQSRPDLVILDIGLPDTSGLSVLARIRERDRAIPVLVITAHGNLENAVEARKRGASAYLVKPLDLRELERSLRSLLEQPEGGSPADAARAPALDPAPLLIGSSPAMQPAFTAIAHACASDAPVLIVGPTGIGKSLTARVIHLHSARQAAPFVTVSCASLPENLLESELFGHEKGAFTGAIAARPGHTERASGGTLFLDEIGEVPLPLQVKLLRFVEEKTFVRVGGREDIRVDLRVIAATNQDLAVAVAEKRFREDLLYRLRVLEVRLPSLRERSSDIPALSSYLLASIGGGRGLTLSAEALRLLCAHSWPGNVRELRNALDYAAAVCTGSVILATHLPAEIRALSGEEQATDAAGLDEAMRRWLDASLREDRDYASLLDELESRLLLALLPRFENKPTHLARALKVNRSTLRKRLRDAFGSRFEP
jgi:DNA-binding NtrC family response regulator